MSLLCFQHSEGHLIWCKWHQQWVSSSIRDLYCSSHCSLSPCLLSLSLYCYNGVTAKVPKMIFIKLRKLIRILALMLSQRFMFLLKTCMLFQNHKTNLWKRPQTFLTWLANPVKRARVMFRRLTDPSTLQYMSFMPISLQRVMTALWQCRPWPADTEKYSGHHGYLNCCWMCKQVSFCWKLSCTCKAGGKCKVFSFRL